MENFGLLKSKIEQKLIDSYTNGTIKENFAEFRNLILSNKNLVSLFYLYDQLSTKSNLSKEFAKEYIEECTKKISEIKVSKDHIKLLDSWIREIDSQNNYTHIDNLLNKDILQIENKLKSKNIILETLTSKNEMEKKEVINIPLKSAISIANKSLESMTNQLSESEKSEFLEIAKLNKEELESEYYNLKTKTLEKLSNLLEQNKDNEIKLKLEETIDKIKQEKTDKINFYRLKMFNKNLI